MRETRAAPGPTRQMRPVPPPFRFANHALTLALLRICCGALMSLCGAVSAQVSSAAADAASAPPAPLATSRELAPPPSGDAARRLPIVLRAASLSGRPDLEAVAEGDAEFRRGGLVIRADRLSYDSPEDLARAIGHVRVRRDGAVYSGPRLELRVERFEGFFLQPEFEFLRLKSGGRAARVDFIDSARSLATDALYTSCPRDGSVDPAWVLKTDRVRMDFDANEGIAEGAVLRFLGVPILALPVLSFPLSDQRKSGWLPPSLNIDNRSGLEVSAPYYWNIAPNRDMTITPRIITRRGVGVDTEFRYLEPSFSGRIELDALPSDSVAHRERHLLNWNQTGSLPWALRYEAELLRVSDDDWWRDFPSTARSITQRLLPTRLSVERDFAFAGGQGLAYARVRQWQVLQGADAVTAPFERSPQLGARASGKVLGGLEWSAETEVNRFTLPTHREATDTRSEGSRGHALGSLSWPLRGSGGWLVPSLAINAASYRSDQALSDGRRSAARVIPTWSVDAGVELERQASLFGRTLRQTLEPRLHYVNTPYRAQDALPNFDAAERDFNFNSIFADNTFAGVDRVSDSHQLIFGATSRLLDSSTGIEALRFGAVQRYLLREQRITGDGAVLSRGLSDLLLIGGTSVIPSWSLDTALQYNPDIGRTKRSVVTARYAPGEFRTVSATYRYTRGQSGQLEAGWQWPLRLSSPGPAAAAAGGSAAASATTSSTGCGGTWYTVGRVNYSTQERRITDSVVGFEYDAGCWIGRVVAERLSTGRSQATTRLLLQLELVGLSRLGANPLKVLRDNIPGYRLLREEGRTTPDTPTYD